MEKLKFFSNGEYRESQTTVYYELHNPSTGEVTGMAPRCTEAEVKEAVEAAKAALTEALAATGLAPKTLLDCGAGTGAVTFAADALLGLERATCLERETAMRAVGQQLMREAGGVQAEWAACDLTAKEPLPRAGLVCEGYMLGELEASMRLHVAGKLWDACEQMLVLIEPGTPQGFANLRAVREALTGRGAYVAAPCPEGSAACPMTKSEAKRS